ncbi:MAG: dimethyl sulfoxide reductase anchor subunit [Nitrospinae bacterium]|nr:dimethyl sulfoxide reductase anchor subunit [Nitrospinota bacterium]
MHPEMSLVFLTVFAGVGQGIFITLVILDALFGTTGNLSPQFTLAAGIISLAFPVLGMAASFFHLGNPQRGWKAIKMWKQSWLSREVIFLPAFLAMDALYLFLFYMQADGTLRLFAGFMGIIAAVGLYISSAMLYAAIRYVREWANAFTPLNFTLFGLTSGTAVILAVCQFTSIHPRIEAGLVNLVAFLASFSLVLKALAFQHNGNIYSPLSLKNALGINAPHIKLRDTGCAYETYNTIEYHFPMTASQQTLHQALTLIVAFFLPLLVALMVSVNPVMPVKTPLIIVCALLNIGGLIIERRLFFTQGNHLQNLYYGNYRITGAKNPLASSARPGVPVPRTVQQE